MITAEKNQKDINGTPVVCTIRAEPHRPHLAIRVNVLSPHIGSPHGLKDFYV